MYTNRLYESHKQNMGYDTVLPDWLQGRSETYNIEHFIVERINELGENGILLEVANSLT
jgi:hypothetical protein